MVSNSIVGSKQRVIYPTCTFWFALCVIQLMLFGLFKQYPVLLPIMCHSSRVWSVQPVLDCFHLHMIDSTCIQSIHPVLAWYNQYLIILSCIQYVWPAEAVFHQFNMYLVDLTDIGAMNQGIELHLLYIRYTGTTVWQWPFQAMHSTHLTCIWLNHTVFHELHLYLIDLTCVGFVQPVLDYFHHIWTIQTVFDGSKQHCWI